MLISCYSSEFPCTAEPNPCLTPSPSKVFPHQTQLNDFGAPPEFAPPSFSVKARQDSLQRKCWQSSTVMSTAACRCADAAGGLQVSTPGTTSGVQRCHRWGGHSWHNLRTKTWHQLIRWQQSVLTLQRWRVNLNICHGYQAVLPGPCRSSGIETRMPSWLLLLYN